MAEETKEKVDAGDDAASARGYERSKIVFPYGDLDDAVSVAKAIYNNSGAQADFDQLVEWMKHENVDSGAFRVKVAAARIFGLASVDGKKVTLLQLGHDTQDPKSESRARALAFLKVPLYKKVFETYRGRPLPDDKGLEKVMESFGVASKQTNRARQTFQRSAEQAKVFNDKKDRLVLPAGVSLDSTTPSNGEKGRKMEIPAIQPSGEVNPLLASLIEELPATGEWTRDEHDLWMRLFQRTMDKLYKVKE
ncbi:MAG TPA: hypothetical protein VJX23_03810 [Candidatus Binataceae bacterium]|nr:hypothetical protein [Candidatus Binataceae bacterium]